MHKKGQAAMEFLMTYGWAILAAIIAIGVLAYFGVFSPGKFVPSATVVNPPFYANAWNVDFSDNAVNLELQNNGGETYIISDISIVVNDGATSCAATGSLGNVDAGDLIRAAIGPCVGLEGAGNNFKGDITITYTKTGASTLPLTSTGTIADTIVP